MITADSNQEAATQPNVTPCRPCFWNSRRLTLLLILLASVVLDLFFFTGFFGSDDISYFGGAVNIVRDGKLIVTMSNGRLTLVGWNLLIITLFGWNGQLCAASYIVFHQILNVSTYCLARRQYGDRVAMLSVFGAATMPLVIVFSTCILPDVPLACCCVLALHAFLRGLDARSSERPGRARMWLLLAGVAVGFGYMAKESALVLLPFFFVLWLSQEWRGLKKPETILRGAMFAFGFFGIMAVETAVLSWLNEGFHFRMAWTVEDMDAGTREHISRFGSGPVERLDYVHAVLNDYFLLEAAKPVIIVCFAVYPFLYRRRWAAFALGLWIFAYLTWGSMRFNEYFPPSIQARYYIPVVPFAMIVAAAVLTRAYDLLCGLATRVRAGRLVQFAAIVLLGAYAILGLRGPDQIAGKIYGADHVTNTAMAIRTAMNGDERPVVLGPLASHRSYRLLQREQFSDVYVWLLIAHGKGFKELAQQGGWHFILVDKDAAHRPSRYKPLKWPVQWLVRSIPTTAEDASSDTSLAMARFVHSLDPMISDYVEYLGYRLFIERIQRIRQPFSRTARFADECLSMFNNWRQTETDKFPGARGVLLIDVAAERLNGEENTFEPTLEALKRLFTPQPKKPKRELVAAIGRGRPTNNAEYLSTGRNSAGGPLVTFKLPQRTFARYEPARKFDARQFKVPPGTQCDLDVIMELTALSTSARVYLDAEFYADPECKTRRGGQQFELRHGRTKLGLRAGEQTVYVRPVLTVVGRGRFGISSFVIAER